MKNLLNRFCLLNAFVVSVGLFVLTSCGNGELTKGSAESALEEGILALQKNSQYLTIPTGYFEVEKENVKEALKRMADAGLITYKLETVVSNV